MREYLQATALEPDERIVLLTHMGREVHSYGTPSQRLAPIRHDDADCVDREEAVARHEPEREQAGAPSQQEHKQPGRYRKCGASGSSVGNAS